MEYFLLVGYGAVGASVWMLAVWCFYLVRGNPAIVDVAWTLCMTGLSLFYFWCSRAFNPVSLTVLALVILWGLRLSSMIALRLMKEHKDGRYVAIDAGLGRGRVLGYLCFYLGQALAAVLLTVPVLLVMLGRTGPWTILDSIAFITALLGLLGESLADSQLQGFKAKEENRGRVCQVGLWSYSRHPNYFFEWVFWVGIFLFSVSAPFALFGLISPVAMLITLLFVSGIPPAEAQALRTKGDAYKAYQARTSAFIPWWPMDARD